MWPTNPATWTRPNTFSTTGRYTAWFTSLRLRGKTARRTAGGRFALCRCQLFSDVPPGVPGARVGHRHHRSYGGIPAVDRKGANIPQATATTQPVIYQSHNLFNPYLGYGSFVMPAIIMVIIQQTMLIGIGMIGGTWSEFGLYKKLIPPGRRRMSTLPVVAGKAFVYASIYAVTLFYILGLHYKFFISRPTVTRRTSSPFSSRICCPVFFLASPSRRCSSGANSRSCCCSGVRSRL